MKNVSLILNDKYHKKILDSKESKKKYDEIKNYLKAFSISSDGEEDHDIFRYELLYASLQIKERFEEVFFDTYVNMYDYWYDLSYQERKKQMNTDIARLMMTLPYFESKNQKIFMPCFDEKFNHLYTDEIVLLDLKQYHTLIRDFSAFVNDHLYGVKPYLLNYTSAQVKAYNETCFVLYHEQMHRFYRYQDGVYHDMLSLDQKKEVDETTLQNIANAYFLNDEDMLLQVILDSDCVAANVKKKLLRYQKKREKHRQER